MPLIESAIEGIAVSVLDKLLTASGYVAGHIKDARDKTVAIEQVLKASQDYADKYLNRHGQIKVISGLMKEPLLLDSIYTAVKLLDDESIRYFVTLDNLETAYRNCGKRSFQFGNDERFDGMEIANQKQYLMVLGGPGVGKSTFLRKLGLEALKKGGQIQRSCIPVFIELKSLRNENVDLTQIIAQEFETCGFPEPEAFTALALRNGKLLVLLDGLDEVPAANVNRIISHIEDFVDQHDQNCFVASCRIAAYRSSFRRFTDVTLAEFDDGQIEQFIIRWFNSELDQQAETAQKYWNLLQKPDYKAAKELAQTPLLLTFLCLVYEREQTLSANRSSLYKNALNILLREWAAQKRLERDPIYEGFNPELEKLLLADIAYTSFKDNQLFFSKDDITERIAAFLSDTLGAPKYLDGEAVLKAIEVHQGILAERAADIYSFSHLTLQEYLAATYIADQQIADEIVAHHLFDERWREVFLLLSGLMKNRALSLLIAIEKKAQDIVISHPKLCALVTWAKAATTNEISSIEAISRRAVALAIAKALSQATGIVISILVEIDSKITRVAAIANRSLNITTVNALARGRNSDIEFAFNEFREELNITFSIGSDLYADSRNFVDRDLNSNIESNFQLLMNECLIKFSDFDFDEAVEQANELIKANFFTTTNFKQLPNELAYLKESVPAPNSSSKEWIKWATSFKSAWLTALELDPGLVSISEEEAKAFSDYLYATELLIRCKESAVRISPPAWEKIEARLLTLDEIPN